MGFHLRHMKPEDIAQVVEIEKASFPTPWSFYAFQCELYDNEFAHYLVLTPEENQDKIIGYGGMWIIIDEAHITNVAVAPSYRNRKLGRCLMQGLILLARQKQALRMTLEVRVSNEPAQRLYRRLNFRPAGVRPGYYAETNEDALIMWRELDDE